MKLKVFISSLITTSFVDDLIDEFHDVDFIFDEDLYNFSEQIGDADVFMGYLPREAFQAAKKLRWLHCPGTGIEKILEIKEIVESDVVITNALDAHTQPMAAHGMGMILTLAHHLRDLWEDQKLRKWDTQHYDGEMLELYGSTMGILGIGGIGSAIAKRARSFGMTVYGIDLNDSLLPEGVQEVWGPDRLSELMAVSDWFVVAVPFTKETENLIDDTQLDYLKKGARIIVLSRGGIVEEASLLERLEDGSIGGAGLDATSIEPLPISSGLWSHPNVLITPHVSALTTEMWDSRREIFKENLRRFVKGKPFLYVCDKDRGY